MERVCLDCGADISHRGLKAIRCEMCAKRRKSEKKSTPQYYKGLFVKNNNQQCRACVYYNTLGFCDYAYRTGRLRTMLHPGEKLNDPCREFEPGVEVRYGMDY